MGAWIETTRSAPSSCRHPVAPYVGAWIETSAVGVSATPNHVAPYVGAWIETHRQAGEVGKLGSHPMWVRGLKPVVCVKSVNLRRSHPMWVRGLKHNDHKAPH